jgi:hypothetical protein
MTNLGDFSWYAGNLDWLARRTIFLTKHGSQAYGTALPTSDIDLKGIAIAPRAYYLGFLQHFEQAEVREPLDAVIYDIRKFFKLAADCNPNIIEMLFTDFEDWIHPDYSKFGFANTLWVQIWTERHLFLSRRAQYTFSGYAIAQLKRIKTHRAWLLDPPKKQPERSDFGLKNGEGTIGKEQLGVIEAEIRKRTDTLAGKGVTKDILEQVDENVVLSAAADLNLDINLVPLIWPSVATPPRPATGPATRNGRPSATLRAPSWRPSMGTTLSTPCIWCGCCVWRTRSWAAARCS